MDLLLVFSVVVVVVVLVEVVDVVDVFDISVHQLQVVAHISGSLIDVQVEHPSAPAET